MIIPWRGPGVTTRDEWAIGGPSAGLDHWPSRRRSGRRLRGSTTPHCRGAPPVTTCTAETCWHLERKKSGRCAGHATHRECTVCASTVRSLARVVTTCMVGAAGLFWRIAVTILSVCLATPQPRRHQTGPAGWPYRPSIPARTTASPSKPSDAAWSATRPTTHRTDDDVRAGRRACDPWCPPS